MAVLSQYDSLQVVGTFTLTTGRTIDILDGAINPGDFVTPTPDNPRWTREFDQGGNTTRVKNNNRGGKLAVVLSASSPTNTALSQVAVKDDLGENQTGVLLLRDLNGNTAVEANGAFLEDIPAPTFGSTRGSRTWVWQCAEMRPFVGGHDPIG